MVCLAQEWGEHKLPLNYPLRTLFKMIHNIWGLKSVKPKKSLCDISFFSQTTENCLET